VRDRGRRNSLDEKYDAVERALEEMFADSPGENFLNTSKSFY